MSTVDVGTRGTRHNSRSSSVLMTPSNFLGPEHNPQINPQDVGRVMHRGASLANETGRIIVSFVDFIQSLGSCSDGDVYNEHLQKSKIRLKSVCFCNAETGLAGQWEMRAERGACRSIACQAARLQTPRGP